MQKLPILEKNAYLTLVLKDNAIWAHLAYVDYSNDQQYILSDYTDISHLRRRLDDHILMDGFWHEYFDLLQENFNWDIFQEISKGFCKKIEFETEGRGVLGVKVLVDDNQDFLTNIFNSLSQYSRDIAIRVMDPLHMRRMIGKFVKKLGYETLLYIDLDIDSFQIYRVGRTNMQVEDLPNKYKYQEVFQHWNNEIGVIDSIKDKRLKAFLSLDIDNSQLQNSWANLILHPVDTLVDPKLLDILRSFTTVQLLSLLTDNREKLSRIGDSDTGIILGGKIPRLLGKKRMLLSLIDGLELYGNFDVIWDVESKILAYATSTSEGIESQDIVIGKNEILSPLTSVLIPELKSKKGKDKVIFAGTIRSQDYEPDTMVVLGDTFEKVDIRNIRNKVIIEGKFEKNVYIPTLKYSKLNLVSSPNGLQYDSLLIDSRLRPVVYGVDSYSNKLKINRWLNAN